MIQEFQNRGVEFLVSGDCFDTPSHVSYIFEERVENKIHIANFEC